MEAIVYISHGSRSKVWNEQFVSFITETMEENIAPIQTYGFFELATPSIGEAIESCIRKGATTVTVVPVLLLSGNHALIDIPTEIAESQARFPTIPIMYANVLGSDRLFLPAIMDKLQEKGYQETQDELVLLVAHGSGHEETAQEFSQLTKVVREELGLPVEWGYLSREPHYLKKLEMTLLQEYQKVYIVPHFLSKGGFTDKIERQLHESFPIEMGNQIILCNPTGYHELLHTMIQERARTPKKPTIKQ
ncbi:CbiX/SirB N-terminal domain-containing protein [Robertmurraya sp. FSL R5-0851]|uniref:CbiX/SirB N-terminal domain-containing protein n=1 Tax=Robertmurraya sp. FSL R5-0851 TaxID=2921584 RepID=UPI00136BB49C